MCPLSITPPPLGRTICRETTLIERKFLAWREAAEWFHNNLDDGIKLLSQPLDQGGMGLSVQALEMLYRDLKTFKWEIVPALKIKDTLFKEFELYRQVGLLEKLPDEGIIYEGLKNYA